MPLQNINSSDGQLNGRGAEASLDIIDPQINEGEITALECQRSTILDELRIRISSLHDSEQQTQGEPPGEWHRACEAVDLDSDCPWDPMTNVYGIQRAEIHN